MTMTQNPMTVAMTPDVVSSVQNSDGSGMAARFNQDVTVNTATYDEDKDAWNTNTETLNYKKGSSAGNPYDLTPVIDGAKSNGGRYINKLKTVPTKYIIVYVNDLYPDLAVKPHFCLITMD